MKRHTDWKSIPVDARGTSVALGNFDGVHLGHQSVIDLARRDAPLGIVTFEPHPREYFTPGAPPFRLMNRDAKASRLAKLGVEHLFEVAFDDEIAHMTPKAFAKEVLCEGLGVSHVVIGEDFCFGKARAGTAKDLEDFGKEMGFEVTRAPLLKAGETTSSSSAIRTALAEGRPQDARDMLGHWHWMEGVVAHGDKRGRDLGYPTANMSIEGLHAPKFGIYAVIVNILTGPHKGAYQGAASLGVKPTFGANMPCLETFIFDFDGVIYDETITVGFVEYLRPEVKFDGIDALIEQMQADCDAARQVLGDLK